MREAFRDADLNFVVHEGHISVYRDSDNPEPTDFEDRFVFPDLAGDATYGRARAQAAALVQQAIDSVPESRPGGC